MLLFFLFIFYDGELRPSDYIDLQVNRANYPLLAEITDSLYYLAATYPDIVRIDSIGLSYEGRQIYYIEVTDNPGIDEDEPGLFFIGTHHANEWTSAVAPLFFADSLVSAYGQDSLITWIVDNCRIWIMPCFNVDGYYYSRDLNHPGWRKNRRPYGGSIGIDPNRNHPGGCSGSAHDTWGGQPGPNTSHVPSNMFFCGPASLSEPENAVLFDFFADKPINALITYHCYGELVTWPWAWSFAQAPDGATFEDLGDTIATMMLNQSGTGPYTPFQQSSWYPICGEYADFTYGYSRYVKGIPCYSFTIELGTSLAPDTISLQQIIRENFKPLVYLASCIDSVTAATPGIVVAPSLQYQQTGNDYVVMWSPRTNAQVNLWRLWELWCEDVVVDTFGASNTRWMLDGFAPDTQYAHSGSYCLRSNFLDGTIAHATTKYPYFVEDGDSISFWVYCDLEDYGDVAFFEISTDGLVWSQLVRMNGTQPWWYNYRRSLSSYIGQSVFFRFRLSTDGNFRYEGICIDDFYPAVTYDSIRLYAPIYDTCYAFTDIAPGIYYYRVRGVNDQGPGIASQLIQVDVPVSIAEKEHCAVSNGSYPTIMNIAQVAFVPDMQVYNILGQRVKTIEKAGIYFMEHNGRFTKTIIVR